MNSLKTKCTSREANFGQPLKKGKVIHETLNEVSKNTPNGEIVDILHYRVMPEQNVLKWLANRLPPAILESTVSMLPLPRQLTSIRVNTLSITREDLLEQLTKSLEGTGFQTNPHPVLLDCIVITKEVLSGISTTLHSAIKSLCVQNNLRRLALESELKIVLVDTGCGEAILRGADLFAKGIRGASQNIIKGDKVCS